MFRYFVAFCAVCAGGLVAAADLAVSLPLLPPQQPGKLVRPSPEQDRLVFDACVTMYGIAYATGRLIYRWFGKHSEAEELRKWSRLHTVILNGIGGVWLIVSGWPALLQRQVIRPSMVVGVLLLVLKARDAWRTWRGLHANPPGAP